nr:hypothetical protein [Burkholderia ambifaria]
MKSGRHEGFEGDRRDPPGSDAPIFSMADYNREADLFAAVLVLATHANGNGSRRLTCRRRLPA